jgi:ferredoxin-thioredoxin reductase catalytic subunit
MNQVEQVYEVLRKAQEPKGYFFNKEKELVYDLLNALLINKERYGYMCCPCRLASGNRQSDEDIMCPCIYRAADVAEYGSCYCNLYVSRQWNEGIVPHVDVPERRPADKLPY